MSFEPQMPGVTPPEPKDPNRVAIPVEEDLEVTEHTGGPVIADTELSAKLQEQKGDQERYIRELKETLQSYKALAGLEPGAAFITSELSQKTNARMAGNQQLKDELTLLWSQLKDVEEEPNLQRRQELLELLDDDLEDFSQQYVAEAA